MDATAPKLTKCKGKAYRIQRRGRETEKKAVKTAKKRCWGSKKSWNRNRAGEVHTDRSLRKKE